MTVAVSVEFVECKETAGKTPVLDVDGTGQEVQWGANRLTLPAGEHKFRAYVRGIAGMKIASTKPIDIEAEDGETLELVYHATGGIWNRIYRLEAKGLEKPRPAAVPAWAYPFIIACIAIPFVALGGALPGALGGGGAAACAAIGRKKDLSVGTRIGACLVVTCGCWGLFVAIFRVVLA